jgi:uracil-DNA glycosylase
MEGQEAHDEVKGIIMRWGDLKFWDTGERQVVEERIDDLLAKKKVINPSKKDLYKALDATPYDKCKVMICGQDPYPEHRYATGIAFSIPEIETPFPPTLEMILKEYCDDLHQEKPPHGNLVKWCEEGVLLWNAIPSCEAGKSLSHEGWDEWQFLTNEIIKVLSEKGVVFALLGRVARLHAASIRKLSNCRVIETAHPSPRGNLNSKMPFTGSRLFSRINAALTEIGHDPVDWRLQPQIP